MSRFSVQGSRQHNRHKPPVNAINQGSRTDSLDFHARQTAAHPLPGGYKLWVNGGLQTLRLETTHLPLIMGVL